MNGFAASRPRSHFIWRFALLAVLAALQLADVATTKVALAIPGNYEMNPAMAWLMSSLGATGWLLPKLALVAFGALALYRLPRWVLGFAVSVYCVIVANNLIAIFGMPGGLA